MFDNNKILVVIPARGGSKGIPRKNIRLLAGKPLISYAIDMAKASSYVDDVVVSTEDSEIALIAEKFGASVIRRSQDLAGDKIPVDPVIFDATVQKEKQTFDEYDIVITVEPTSPLLKTKTLDEAIEKFKSFDVDTVISVYGDKHLSWGYDEENKKYHPYFSERLNKQYLPKEYVETGGIFATRRAFITPNSRLGENVDLIEISKQEAINIDDYDDWWVIERHINSKSIAIVVKANDEVGINHLDRCISIASKLQSKNFKFFLDESYELAIKKLNEYDFPFQIYDDLDELFKALDEYGPKIIINDILDTSEEYITQLKDANYFVVNFEDLGSGFEHADVVFDDLYEHDGGFENIFSNHKYYILKDEFYFQPHKIINSEVNDVLIFFEGRDSNNLTKKSLDSVLSSGYDGRIDVILDWNYPNKMDLIEEYEDNNNVQIYTDLNKISEFIFKSDIIISSTGKLIYEICSIGVPCICICQNGREQTHRFAAHKNGFINLGLGETVSSDEITNQFETIWKDCELRQNMSKLMLGFDFKNGFENMWAVVEEKYREYQFKNNGV